MEDRDPGYIKLYRKFQSNFLWMRKRKFSEAEAWIDILYEVRWKEGDPDKVLIGRKVVPCGYAQSLNSMSTWAKRWGWSRFQVMRFFDLLKDEGMITTEAVCGKTLRLTVCNYETYHKAVNSTRTADAQHEHTSRTPDAPQAHTEEEGKEIEEGEEERKRRIELIALETSADDIIKAYAAKVKRKALDNSGSIKKRKETITNILQSGITKEDLLRSVDNYAEHCRRTNVDEKFRKGAQTFFGPAQQVWRDFRDELGGDYPAEGADLTPTQRLAARTAGKFDGMD